MPRFLILWTLAPFAAWPQTAFAEKRVALVIGNGAYQNVFQLPNPTQDADAMDDLFEKAGLDAVQMRNDLGHLD